MKHHIPSTFLLACFLFTFPIAWGQDCRSSRDQQLKELEALIEDLDKNGFSEEYAKQMVQWSDRFKAEYQAFDAWGLAGTTTEGSMIGAMANLLASGTLGASSLGIGAVLGLGYGEFKRWATNTANLWYKADLNSEIYSWLAEYVDSGKKLPSSELLEDFVGQNRTLLTKLLNEKPPAESDKLQDYLARHAYELFYFLGRMEEMLGSSKFVRHKWPYVQGAYGGNRQEVGYYRRVMKAKLKEELLKLKQEMRELPTCNAQAGASPLNSDEAPSSAAAPAAKVQDEVPQQATASPNNPSTADSKPQNPTPSAESAAPTQTVLDSGSFSQASVPAYYAGSDSAPDLSPLLGASVGFGGGTDQDFRACAGIQYQHPLGGRFGSCNSQAMLGASLDYEYAGNSDEFYSYRQHWLTAAPQLALFTPVNCFELISGLRFPVGFGISTNQDKVSGSGESFGYRYTRYGARFFGGLSLNVGRFNLQATTDLLSFTHQISKPKNLPDQSSTSNTFSLLLNKANPFRLSLNIPLGGDDLRR